MQEVNDQEVKVMKDILRANLKGFPKLIDWGKVDMSSFPELNYFHG